jgi:hypothetical protein
MINDICKLIMKFMYQKRTALVRLCTFDIGVLYKVVIT